MTDGGRAETPNIAAPPGQKIQNDCFEVGGSIIGFAPGAAGLAQIIRYQIGGPVVPIRHNRRRTIRFTQSKAQGAIPRNPTTRRSEG